MPEQIPVSDAGRVEDPNIAHSMANVENQWRNKKPRGAVRRAFAVAKEKILEDKNLEEAQRFAEQLGNSLETEKRLAKEFATTLEQAAQEATGFYEDIRKA